MGSTAFDRSNQLFSGKAVPELDPQQFGPHGRGVPYVDFLVPLEEVREKTKQIVEASKLWDKRVFAFQVTDFKTDSVEIRILASAENSPKLFDLRCVRDAISTNS